MRWEVPCTRDRVYSEFQEPGYGLVEFAEELPGMQERLLCGAVCIHRSSHVASRKEIAAFS